MTNDSILAMHDAELGIWSSTALSPGINGSVSGPMLCKRPLIAANEQAKSIDIAASTKIDMILSRFVEKTAIRPRRTCV